MNIALFGGTFDPIHCGHLCAARAARERFALDRVYFIPAGRPPHRGRDRLTPFEHRYAMVTLACAGEPGFLPSLAESPSRRGANYSISTVRRFRRELGPGDRLFFLLGIDAFLEFRTWRQWWLLLNAADFVIVSRPGFSLDRVAQVLPAGLLAKDVPADPRLRVFPAGRRARRAAPDPGSDPAQEFRLRRTSAWVLAGVWEPISATEVRRRAHSRKNLAGLVPPPVAEYIVKQCLYQ